MRQKDLDLARRDRVSRVSLLHSRDYYSISDDIFQKLSSFLFVCLYTKHEHTWLETQFIKSYKIILIMSAISKLLKCSLIPL